MDSSPQTGNLLGAVLAVAINTLLIILFVARLGDRPKVEYVLGLVLIAAIIPLVYLFIKALGSGRSPLYFVQLGLMMAYLVVELMLDYLLKVEFRETRWMVIAYVTLFFAATGGMIGVAGLAGKGWSIAAIVSFLIMAALAFVQRSITGK
jgi:hypothetical protein